MYFNKDPFVVEISKIVHLGDAISILTILFNYCIKTKRSCVLYNCNSTTFDLLKILNIKFIIPKFRNISSTFNLSISDMLGIQSDVLFLKNKYILCDEEILIKEIITPSIINNQIKKYCFFQLDQKSSHIKKPLLTIEEKIKIIKKFKIENTFGIGGFDTEKIEDENYIIGNLNNTFNMFKQCKYYFGIDSGMSHVAGLHKIPGNVIITHIEEKDILDIKNFFNRFYPLLKCHSKSEL